MADIIAKVTGRVQELLFDQHAFMEHVRAGNLVEVRKGLEDPRMALHGPDIKDEIGQMPIHCAAGRGDVQMIKLLCSKGADVNAVTDDDEYKRTALHICCMLGMTDGMYCLLESGANPLIQDLKGKAPIFYARDAASVRALQRAGIIETNLQSAQRSFELMERIVGQGGVSAAVTQHLGDVEDATRVIRTYQGWQNAVQGRVKKGTDPDVPAIKVPALSAVLSALKSMKDEKTMEVGYFAFMPRGDAKDTLSAMLKIMYMDYNGQNAMQISDVFVQQRWRRKMLATWLVTHVCDFALRGPKHISKVFTVVPDGNLAARLFFSAIGFHKEPAYNVPWKYRRAGQAVYQVHHSGMALAHMAMLIQKRAEKEDEWITSEDLEARKLAEIEAAKVRDYQAWEKKLQEAERPRPLEKLQKPGPVFKGVPLLQLQNETDRLKQLGVLAVKKETHFICENDRIPLELVDKYRSTLERSRRVFEWEMRPLMRKERQSRILNCPAELRNAWLEELESDANANMPPGWISCLDESGDQLYFNVDTHARSKIRPATELSKAQEEETASELRLSKVKKRNVASSSPSSKSINSILELPFVINVAAQLQEEQERKQRELATRQKNDETVDEMVERAKDIGGTFEHVVEMIENHKAAVNLDEKDAAYMISRAKKCFADSAWAKPWNIDAIPPSEKTAPAVVAKVEQTEGKVQVSRKNMNDGDFNEDSLTAVSGQSFGQSSQVIPLQRERMTVKPRRVDENTPAKWIEICAEREKALYDADSLLNQFSPPVKLETSSRKTKNSWPSSPRSENSSQSLFLHRPETAPEADFNRIDTGKGDLALYSTNLRPGTAPEAAHSWMYQQVDINSRGLPMILSNGDCRGGSNVKVLDSRPSTSLSQASTVRPGTSCSVESPSRSSRIGVTLPRSPFRP